MSTFRSISIIILIECVLISINSVPIYGIITITPNQTITNGKNVDNSTLSSNTTLITGQSVESAVLDHLGPSSSGHDHESKHVDAAAKGGLLSISGGEKHGELHKHGVAHKDSDYEKDKGFFFMKAYGWDREKKKSSMGAKGEVHANTGKKQFEKHAKGFVKKLNVNSEKSSDGHENSIGKLFKLPLTPEVHYMDEQENDNYIKRDYPKYYSKYDNGYSTNRPLLINGIQIGDDSIYRNKQHGDGYFKQNYYHHDDGLNQINGDYLRGDNYYNLRKHGLGSYKRFGDDHEQPITQHHIDDEKSADYKYHLPNTYHYNSEPYRMSEKRKFDYMPKYHSFYPKRKHNYDMYRGSHYYQ